MSAPEDSLVIESSVLGDGATVAVEEPASLDSGQRGAGGRIPALVMRQTRGFRRGRKLSELPRLQPQSPSAGL